MDILKFNLRQSADGKALDLYIYSEVQPDYYECDGWSYKKVVSETSADYFREQLAQFSGVKQINLFINSIGGSVMEGYGIYCQLVRHPANITAYIDGFACSIATVIACAADHVVAYPNSMFYIHNMTDCVCGNAEQLRKAADDLDKIMEGNRQVYITKSGGKLTEDELTAMLNDGRWLTASECLEYGFVDEIKSEGGIDDKKAEELLEKSNASLKNQLLRRQMLQRMMQESTSNIEDQEPSLKEDPKSPKEPTPEEKVENTLMQMFSSFIK